MCVIVLKPVGHTLSAEIINRSYTANPQGWGLAWWKPAVTKTRKRAASKAAWYYCRGLDRVSLIDACAEYLREDSVALLHCRIASKGSVSLENTHPFPMTRHGGLLMHNGTLSGLDPVSVGGTDSEALASLLDSIDNLEELLDNPVWVEGLSELVSPSRVVLMTDNNGSPRVTIFGQDRGVTHEGLWASNDGAFGTFKAKLPAVYAGMEYESPYFSEWNKHGRGTYANAKARRFGYYDYDEKRYVTYDEMVAEDPCKAVDATGALMFSETEVADSEATFRDGSTKSLTESDGSGATALLEKVAHSIAEATQFEITEEQAMKLAIRDSLNDVDAAVADAKKLDDEPSVTDDLDGPAGTVCMASADAFECCPRFMDVLNLARNEPYLAAKALWYYHGLGV